MKWNISVVELNKIKKNVFINSIAIEINKIENWVSRGDRLPSRLTAKILAEFI